MLVVFAVGLKSSYVNLQLAEVVILRGVCLLFEHQSWLFEFRAVFQFESSLRFLEIILQVAHHQGHQLIFVLGVHDIPACDYEVRQLVVDFYFRVQGLVAVPAAEVGQKN